MPELRVVVSHESLLMMASSSSLSTSPFSIVTSSVSSTPTGCKTPSQGCQGESDARSSFSTRLPQHGDSNSGEDGEDANDCTLLPTEITEALQVLQRHERELYPQPADYLHALRNACKTDRRKIIDEVCREKMCHWCVGIAQACDFELETVWMAMSYLDRMLTADPVHFGSSRSTFQLVCMSCLYVAAKLHETMGLSSKQIASVSKGKFDRCRVEEMENEIMFALGWRLHPISPHAYWRLLLPCIDCMIVPESIGSERQPHSTLMFDEKERSAILNIAEMQLEMALSNYAFVSTPSYVTAYCTMVNAFDYMQLTNQYCYHKGQSNGSKTTSKHDIQSQRVYFQHMMQHALGWQPQEHEHDVISTGQRLWQLLVASSQNVSKVSKNSLQSSPSFVRSNDRRSSKPESPRSIWESNDFVV